MSTTTYLQRYAYPETWIETPPNPETELIVAIPAYNEKSLIPVFDSIKRCKSPDCAVEVIGLINTPFSADFTVKETNELCFNEASEWVEKNNDAGLSFHVIHADDLSDKDHGVGLARKIAMDEALRRLIQIGKEETGIIACFDSDCTCETNYLQVLHSTFAKNKNITGASIYFEHPLESTNNPNELSGIAQYELHLRYYIHAQRFGGFPGAYHTVGSSMAVRAKSYYKQGGMNKRKAGEDFYFLHRIISLGNYVDISDTSVFPSLRTSNRVPFGTGRAMLEWKTSITHTYYTYNPKSFTELRSLFFHLKDLYNGTLSQRDLPPGLCDYLKHEDFETQVKNLKEKTSDFYSFKKRFFHWFNAFRIMKFLHFARDYHYENVPITQASLWLLDNYFGIKPAENDAMSILKIYRSIDKKGSKEMG